MVLKKMRQKIYCVIFYYRILKTMINGGCTALLAWATPNILKQYNELKIHSS